MGNRCAIIVSVHADDEIYLSGSLLLKYPYEIILHVLFLGDMCTSYESYVNELSKLYKSIDTFNTYRSIRGYGRISVVTREYEESVVAYDNLTPKQFHRAISCIEKSIEYYDKVDYYLKSPETTHQNHTHSNRISNAVLRSPYIDKIENIITAQYPTDFSVGNNPEINFYQVLSEEEVDFLCGVLYEVYNSKLDNRWTLSSDTFRLNLKFMGSCIQKDYAQGYHLNRGII